MTLEEQLIRDEGEILHAYQDSLGLWTIGVGHLIDQRKGGSIPAEISKALLRIDIAATERFLSDNLPWSMTLDEPRRAVLANMHFNLGNNLLEFRNFLAALQAGNYGVAADEMLNSLWEKQVGPRAHRLAKQLLSGEWQ